jgi:hypothetical protein
MGKIMAMPILMRGLSSASAVGNGRHEFHTYVEDGPESAKRRLAHIRLDENDIIFLLGHLATRPEYRGVFRGIADALDARDEEQESGNLNAVDKEFRAGYGYTSRMVREVAGKALKQ